MRAKPYCRMQNIYGVIANREMMPGRTVVAGVLELSESLQYGFQLSFGRSTFFRLGMIASRNGG